MATSLVAGVSVNTAGGLVAPTLNHHKTLKSDFELGNPAMATGLIDRSSKEISAPVFGPKMDA